MVILETSNGAVICKTHLLTPGKGVSWVRHVPTYWWHIVPSWKQKVSHIIDPYVRHDQSMYHECVRGPRHNTRMKWCVTISIHMCVNAATWWVAFNDWGCVMVHKSMTHIGTMTHHSRGSIGGSYKWQLHND